MQPSIRFSRSVVATKQRIEARDQVRKAAKSQTRTPLPGTPIAGLGKPQRAPMKHPPAIRRSAFQRLPTLAKTRVLELGARVLQGNTPVARMDIHLNGFHPMKAHPEHQMEAHHFCHQMNQDFAQCALFDGSGAEARLNGVEYIISEMLFATLPEAEKKYWHPHNAEILSGQLVAPGLPAMAETALMKDKINSYGKTWHVWKTGRAGADGDALPLGEPMLAWSFNRDGEDAPGLVAQRDARLGVRSSDKRAERVDLRNLARPQSGVDALKGAFGRSTQDIPGVVDLRPANAGTLAQTPATRPVAPVP